MAKNNRRVLANGLVLLRTPNPNQYGGYTYYIETPRDDSDCGYPNTLVWDSFSTPPDVIAACLAWELDKTPFEPQTLTKDFNMKG